jgi:hypothetical protein
MRVLELLAVAAVLACGCDVQVGEKGFSLDFVHGKAADEWRRTYTLPAGGTLDIVNINGAMRRPWRRAVTSKCGLAA